MNEIKNLGIEIIKILSDNYPDVNIYETEVEQGKEKPCFFVQFLNSKIIKLLNNRYKKSLKYKISFIKSEGDFDYRDLINEFYHLFEKVIVEGEIYRTSKFESELNENILEVTLEFNYHIIRKNESIDKMLELNQEVNIKNE